MIYDIIIIGGGAGGLTAASRAAELGASVALINNGRLGGSCLYSGCVPSKALVKTAKVAHTISQGETFGLKNVHFNVNLGEVMDKVHDIVKHIGTREDHGHFRAQGVDVIFGSAHFLNDHCVEIRLPQDFQSIQQKKILKQKTKNHTITLQAKHFIISTGSRPFVPPIKGIEHIDYLTNENLFQLRELPHSLIIIGGGPIGTEIAQAFARLGTKVTMMTLGPRILDRLDDDVSAIITETLASEGVRMIGSITKQEFAETDHVRGIHNIAITRNGKREIIEAHKVLIATGRKPQVDNLCLDKAGIIYSDKGIRTDNRLRTNKKHMYAIGDVNGQSFFSNKARHEGRIAVENALTRFTKSINLNEMPWTTFTDPEIASCGMNEREASEAGVDFQTWKGSFEKQSMAVIERAPRGLMKILTTGRKGKIIGAQIVGPRAGELIHEFVIAFRMGLSIQAIADTMHVYPTLAELAKTTASTFYQKTKQSKRMKIIPNLQPRIQRKRAVGSAR